MLSQSGRQQLDEASYREALLAKLIEEVQEASHATTDGLPGELGDALEVLRVLPVTAGIPWAQLLALADSKRSRRGSSGRRIFLEAEHAATSLENWWLSARRKQDHPTAFSRWPLTARASSACTVTSVLRRE